MKSILVFSLMLATPLLAVQPGYTQPTLRQATYVGTAHSFTHRPTTSQKKGFSSNYFKLIEVNGTSDGYSFSTIDSKFLRLPILNYFGGSFIILKDVDCSKQNSVFDCGASFVSNTRNVEEKKFEETVAMLAHDGRISTDDIAIFNEWLKLHIQMDQAGYNQSKTLMCFDRHPVSKSSASSTFGTSSKSSAHERVCLWASQSEVQTIEKAFGKGQDPTNYVLDGINYSSVQSNDPLYLFMDSHSIGGAYPWDDPNEQTRSHYSEIKGQDDQYLGALVLRINRTKQIVEPHFEVTPDSYKRIPVFMPFDAIGLLDSLRALNKIPYENQVTSAKAKSLLKFDSWETHAQLVDQAFDNFESYILSGSPMYIRMNAESDVPLFNELVIPSLSLPGPYKEILIQCNSPDVKFRYGRRFCPIEVMK